MTDTVQLVISLTVLAVSISAYLRSRYWAKRAEAAAKEANLAYFRAHDSAMEAEQSANRT